jgi:hypothetical protein
MNITGKLPLKASFFCHFLSLSLRTIHHRSERACGPDFRSIFFPTIRLFHIWKIVKSYS